MRNKYKVEIKQTNTYCIDVEADNEEQAKKKATKKWVEICGAGIYHYHETEDPETKISTVYDVTHTEDPFNP